MILKGIWIKFKITESELDELETELWTSHSDDNEIRIIVSEDTKADVISKLYSLGLADEYIREIRKFKELDYIVLWR